MSDLISVVVPIYGVEEFLDNCVQSIFKQTYSNLEIILVDDGSPDNCGKMCDEYAKKDTRIKVIHKLNGGLSDARNAGIDIATGNYITFIDSDDYFSPDAIEYLYKLIKDYDAQVSIGGLRKTSSLTDKFQESENGIEIFNNYESIREMLYSQKYSTAAPGKMYNTDLFNNVRYPLGKFSEDLFTTYKVLEKAERVVYGARTIYYYYTRCGSITVSGFSSRQMDVVEALNMIKSEIPLEEKGIMNAYASQMVEDIMAMLVRKPNNREIINLGLWQLIKDYRKLVVVDRNASKRVRGYALLSFLGLSLTKEILIIYYKRKWNG